MNHPMNQADPPKAQPPIGLGKNISIANPLWVLLLLIVLSLVTVVLMQVRDKAERLEFAVHSNENAVRSAAHMLDMYMYVADSRLQFIAGRKPSLWLNSKNPNPAQLAERESLQDLMNRFVQTSKGIYMAYGVLDREGYAILRAPRLPAGTPAVFAGDRGYFQEARTLTPANNRIIYADVLFSRASGDNVFVMARPLFDAQGLFAGVVTITVSVEKIKEQFASLDLGEQGRVVIRRTDSRKLVLRIPEVPGLVNSDRYFSEQAFAKLEQGEISGNYTFESKLDGVKRIASFYKVPTHPYMVDVGLAESEVLRGWYRTTGLAVGIYISFLALGLTFLWRNEQQHRKHEKLLAQEMENSQKANMAKSEFLSRMSHELRTPLNAIIGFAQILAISKNPPLSAIQQNNVNDILQGGKHLLALINEVLDLSRIESGRLSIELSPVSLATKFHNVLTIIKPLAQQRGITLVPVLMQESDAHVYADRLRLRQVLLNLVTNAVKYNHPGGVVEISVFRAALALPSAPPYWRIEIKDTGLGIERKLHHQVFEPFNRLEQEGSNESGSGIGLSICKQLVLAMGGRIGFESEKGRGSTFWVELPLVQDERLFERVPPSEGSSPQVNTHLNTQAVQAPAAVGPSAEVSPAKDRPVILYVEDNPSNVRLMQSLAQAFLTCSLQVASRAEQGLEMMRAARPDLVLMDLNMPGMYGMDAVREMKADPKLRDIPVIVVSADAMPATLVEAREAGAIDFVIKPYELDKLSAAINKALKR